MSLLKKILGILTDLLTAGRGLGWWTKKPSVLDTAKKKDFPRSGN